MFYLVPAVPEAPQDGPSLVSRGGEKPGAQILPGEKKGIGGGQGGLLQGRPHPKNLLPTPKKTLTLLKTF